MAKLASGSDKLSKPVKEAASAAFEHLHTRGSYKPTDLATEEPYRNLIDATKNAFNTAIKDGNVPAQMTKYLQKDNHVFSGLKTHAQLLEASRLLVDDKGQKRPYEAFERDILKINETYNRNYLQAEYLFATQSAQMAGKWAGFEAGAGRYNLQYRTAGDSKVRVSHQVLNNTTLPFEDSFWSLYYPPNGWRCRCNVVEVRKGKYEESDSTTAIANGEKATSELDKNGKNRLEIFRFNPGKDKALFPPDNPYTKVVGAPQAKAIVQRAAGTGWGIENEVHGVSDLNKVMDSFAQAYPEYFHRGFKTLQVERNRNNNGSTDRNGTISLSSVRMELVKDAFNNIRSGVKTTFEQEDALSTLWHEIMHCKSKSPRLPLTATERQNMELANEYVSRKTLKTFMSNLGGELQNKELENNRKSTGYNTMVVNYDKLVEWSGADKNKVLETVSKHLIEGNYKEQIAGLVAAIKENSPYAIKGVRELVTKARAYPTNYFEKHLEDSKELLVKKKR